MSVIPWQVLKMFKNRATYIAQGELFAPFLAILTNLKDATGQHLLVFCDNLGILSAAVSGRSSVLDVNSLLTGLHLLLTSLRVTSWWEHVDTHANPADGGSRQGTSCKLAKRLGIPLEWVKFPFVPACMAAAGPTEWLKFFKTNLLLTSLRVTSWWEHVDTHANPADGGSRQGTSCKLAKRLGIPLEWVKFPFVPACMAAAGPTEWLKFFKCFSTFWNPLFVMAILCALSSLAISASALLRQEFSESWVEAGLNHLPRVEGALKPPPQYYDQQTVDHFSDQSGTFTQKFYEDAEFYVPGGPVFLYIGGEGPMSSSAVTGRTVNHYLAQVFGGTTVALEHRFYGESQPFDSLATEHLDLLTSRQALHDLVQFQQWYVAERNLTGAVFCLGGSYPGNLAAWYRLEFPDLTAGCWSASGPVHAQEDWPGFGQKVWEAMSTTKFNTQDDELANKLFLGYQQLAELIQDGTPGASVAVQQRLNACPGSLTSQADRDNWEMSITTYPGLIMQYNNTYPVHLADIKTVVQAASTPLDAAFAVTDFLNVTKSAEGHRFPDTRKKQADPCCASQVRGDHCRALVCGLSCAYGPVPLETSGTGVGVW